MNVVDLSNPVNWQNPLNAGLVAWWIAPQSALGWDCLLDVGPCRIKGAAAGATEYSTPDVFGRFTAPVFDGSNDNFVLSGDVTKLEITGNKTAVAWVKTTTAATYREVLSLSSAGTFQGFTLALSGSVAGRPAFYHSDSAYFRDASSGSTNDGNWHQIAVTIEPGVGYVLYLDGQNVGSGSVSACSYSAGATKWIGAFPTYRWSAFTLGDVRYYDRVLGQGEILSLYEASHPANPLQYGSQLNWVDSEIPGDSSAAAFSLSGSLTGSAGSVAGSLTAAAPTFALSGSLTGSAGNAAGSLASTPPAFALSGSLTGSAGSVAGSLTAVAPTFALSGSLAGSAGTAAGSLTSTPPAFSLSGSLTGSAGSVAGSLTATAPTFALSGSLTGSAGTAAGTLTSTPPAFSLSGSLTGSAGSVAGSLTAAAPTFALSGSLTGSAGTAAGTLTSTPPAFSLSGSLTGSAGSVAGSLTAAAPTFALSGSLAGSAGTAAGTLASTPPAFALSGSLTGSAGSVSGLLSFGTSIVYVIIVDIQRCDETTATRYDSDSIHRQDELIDLARPAGDVLIHRIDQGAVQ